MRLYLSSYRLGNKPEEMLALLTGRKRTTIINNAMDFVGSEERAGSLAREAGDLRGIGLEPTEIDLRNYFGKPNELKEALSNFELVWVRGGNAFILRRAFRQSGADEIIKELLTNNTIVYGGYSAGIDMLTPSLHGAELVDNPNTVPEGYESPIIWDCLGVLDYAIAPHYKSDHPESAAVDKSVEYLIDNHIPFIALRDGEAIVRNDDNEVIVG